MSQVIETKCDRCGKQGNSYATRFLDVRIMGRSSHGEHTDKADLCSEKCLHEWLASSERFWRLA